MNQCILFALSRESRPFLRLAPLLRPLRAAPFPAWISSPPDKRMCIAETGVGRERCLRALHWLLSNGMSKQTQVIGAGFAGALAEGWRVGDVLLAREVIDEQGNCWPTPLSSLDSAPSPARVGRLLSTARLIAAPDEKKKLGRLHHADAVDMESAAAASFCAEHGLSFLAVRAISDDATTSLSPGLVRLLGGSRVSVTRLLATVVRSPSIMGELWRLARATRKAASCLADFLWPLAA